MGHSDQDGPPRWSEDMISNSVSTPVRGLQRCPHGNLDPRGMGACHECYCPSRAHVRYDRVTGPFLRPRPRNEQRQLRRRIPVLRSRVTWLWVGYFVLTGLVGAKYQSTLTSGDGYSPSSTAMDIGAGLIAPFFLLVTPLGVLTWPIMGLLTWVARKRDLRRRGPRFFEP